MNTFVDLQSVARENVQRDASQFDSLVVVAHSPLGAALEKLSLPDGAAAAIQAVLSADRAFARGPQGPVVIPAVGVPGGRLVLCTMNTLADDVDDVRLVAESVSSAILRAIASGSQRPLLAVALIDDKRYARGLEVAALAALATQWQAVEAREAGKAAEPIKSIAIIGLDPARVATLKAYELGRVLARDIVGTEPERMAPLRVAELCEAAFAGTSVKVGIERDTAAYPLLSAVSRASMGVARHRPCVIRLEYVPKGAVSRTLLLAGKGVTYDTGGADLKTGGSMAGMSRDKGGAGAVAGFVRACAAAELPNTRVVAMLGMVRNSIGEEAFVSDEVIKSHAGVRVRIGNTDAEGRLVLADLLSALRTTSSDAVDPVLSSVATLTGHVIRAFGPYVGAIENGVARNKGVIASLAQGAELWGEPMEWTRVRREDYAFCAARSNAEDLVSSNRLASVDTARGHQGPFAFLDVASGLKDSGLPYVHLDIGGGAFMPLDWQFGRPTAAPMLTLLSWATGHSF
jgi:leucyl aminopeptidase